MNLPSIRGARLRRGLAFAALPLALVVAACGSATPSAPTAAPVADAYTAAGKVFDAPLDRVKINVGVTATGDEAIEIKPEAIELVIDQTTGKGSVHLSIPAAALGSDAAALGALGGGDTIDIDALFDGQGRVREEPAGGHAAAVPRDAGHAAAERRPLRLAQAGHGRGAVRDHRHAGRDARVLRRTRPTSSRTSIRPTPAAARGRGRHRDGGRAGAAQRRRFHAPAAQRRPQEARGERPRGPAADRPAPGPRRRGRDRAR